MSWDQLWSTVLENRETARQADTEPPEVCPFDGTILDVNARGIRNCRMGNYQWPRDGKLLK